MYSVNFTATRKKFCLSLHYNGTNIYLFVNGKWIVKFKTKVSAIVATSLCLRNISKDWSVDNLKKIRLNGYVYQISVDYNTFNNSVDLNKTMSLIHSYFIFKYSIN